MKHEQIPGWLEDAATAARMSVVYIADDDWDVIDARALPPDPELPATH